MPASFPRRPGPGPWRLGTRKTTDASQPTPLPSRPLAFLATPSAPAVLDDTIYSESRRNYNALLFRGIAAPQQPFLLWALRRPALPEDPIYESRRDFSALLFWRNLPPEEAAAAALFQSSSRLLDVEPDYSRFNHQQFFAIAQPQNPIAVVVPAVIAGLLPGRPPGPPEELGKGMGPYKRPGQVFGEPDPVSPFLTARAPEIAAAQVVSSARLIVQPLQMDLLNEDEFIAFLVLYMECARDKR